MKRLISQKFIVRFGFIICSLVLFLNIINIGESEAIPSEFKLVETAIGIEVYSNLTGDFVQTIDLTENAGIVFLQGEKVGEGVPAAYEGINPQFQRQSLTEFWQGLVEDYGNLAFSVCNGQFFKGGDPTELAFPVQTEGKIVSTGYAGIEEFYGEKVVFGVKNKTAEIVPFPESSNFRNTDFPYQEAIVGIFKAGAIEPNKWYSKDPLIERPRTFLGVADFNSDNQNETILILTSVGKTQLGAAELLYEFGANQVMMLDGGGSTQLNIKGKEELSSTDVSSRTIPQAIGIFQGF
ncbi:MAG: phosphodiester glycosidase family protein [Microcoleaceae cyanobacterium]